MRKIDLKNCFMMLIDMGVVYYSFFFASLLINNFRIDTDLETVIYSLIWLLPLYLIIFTFFNLYKTILEFAGIEEVLHVFFSVLVGYILTSLIVITFNLSIHPNLLILSHLILYITLICVRFSYRLINNFYHLFNKNNVRTLVIGAGSAGSLLIKEVKSNIDIKNNIVCLVDDDIKKIGKAIQGVKVVGTTRQLKYLVFKYKIDEIIVSIPSASKLEYKRILNYCEDLSVKVKVFPPFYDLIEKSFSLDKIRDVEIEDLLGREEVKIDDKEIYDYLENEVVLITGGGGSIGSEIARQLINFNPSSIIIFDQYENNAYEIEQELLTEINKKNIGVQIQVLIGSVQDEDRLKEVFNEYRVSIVFHAAAHKHVPLMEESPKEAIKNNVFGTYNMAKFAHSYKVKKFVLISSDKAVNPTNVMGATKRLSEMIINAFNGMSLTQYTAVRFGNVLGSNGSVVPLFMKQIKEGGPVTVTHKDVIRYFMTISEAVSLVLQAGAYSRGGEIFVLDMGEPVKILDLAENLIRLSGYEPYREIDILITGLRPGDKLYEELLRDDENLLKTPHEKIYYLRQNLCFLDIVEEYLDELRYLITLKEPNIHQTISKLIPTWRQC